MVCVGVYLQGQGRFVGVGRGCRALNVQVILSRTPDYQNVEGYPKKQVCPSHPVDQQRSERVCAWSEAAVLGLWRRFHYSG